MDSHALPTTRALAAAVRGAEAVAALPAVPTPDWCDRAARSLLPADRSAAAILSLATVNPDGSVARIEAVGAAAAAITEVATNVGRLQSGSAPIIFDPTHTGLSHLRGAASSARQVGWSPGPLLAAPTHAAPASRMGHNDGPLSSRWSGGAGVGIGAVQTILGADWIGSPDQGRAILVELGLGDSPRSLDDAEVQEIAQVLGALIPSVARRAALAFDPDQPIEVQQLTTREETVLRLLLEGKSVRIIAEELGRSPHTVHDHVKSLHRKLNASTRGALVARALGHLRADQTVVSGGRAAGSRPGPQSTESPPAATSRPG